MKKIFSIALGCVALASLFSCSEESYDEKYADPSKTQTVGVPQVFTAIMMKGNTWMNPVYYRWYVQSSTSGVFSGVVGEANGRGRFRGASEGYFNTRWKNFYDMLTQYRVLENTYDQLSEAERSANEVFVHLGRTVLEAQLHEMMSLFGDVPFTGAGTLWKTSDYAGAKEAAVYDDDQALYVQILNDLKQTNDFLAGPINAAGLTALSMQDFTTAGGDVDMWRRFTNSLRLRIALHCATNGAITSQAQAVIGEILNNPTQYPLIESADQLMGVTANTSDDTFNYGKGTSQALAQSAYGAGSKSMLDAMNVPANGIPDANTDPRLAFVYDCNPDGEYIAYDVTMTSTEIDQLASEKTKYFLDKGISQCNYFCRMDSMAVAGWADYQGNENLNGIWIGPAEVALSKAEAYAMGYGVAADEAKAKENFVNGVVASIEYYKNMKLNSSMYAGNLNDSYKGYRELVIPTEAEEKAYAESIWDGTQKCIATQLWLNFGFMNELEAWNVVRRTGYPFNEFASDRQRTDYATPPHRLPYPSDEINYNADNYAAAKAANYVEDTGYYSPLFWAKKDYFNIVADK